MVALLEKQMSQRCRGRHSRCKGVACYTTLKHGHIFFERHACRVLRSRVFETLVLTQAFLHVRGRLVNWNGYGPGCGIGFLPSVNSVCLKAHRKNRNTRSTRSTRSSCASWASCVPFFSYS